MIVIRWPLVAAFVLLSGCYRMELERFEPDYDGKGGKPAKDADGALLETRVSHGTLFWGLVPLGSIDLFEVCGDKGVWSISTRANAITFVSTVLTATIYVPMYARVVCRS